MTVVYCRFPSRHDDARSNTRPARLGQLRSAFGRGEFDRRQTTVSLSPHRFRAHPLTRPLALHKNGLVAVGDMYVIGLGKSLGYRAAPGGRRTQEGFIPAAGRRPVLLPGQYDATSEIRARRNSSYVSMSFHAVDSTPTADERV